MNWSHLKSMVLALCLAAFGCDQAIESEAAGETRNADAKQTQFVLPAPSGHYAVGTVTFFITDETRALELLEAGDRRRVIGVRLWGPTASGGKKAYYVDTQMSDAMAEVGYFDIPAEILSHWDELEVSVVRDARISRQQKWPLVIFGHGYGVSGVNYTIFAQELASLGMVVAVVDSPGLGFMLGPDGETWSIESFEAPGEENGDIQTNLAALDMQAVMNEIVRQQDAYSIDPTKIVMMGHSLGGAAALEACNNALAVTACVNMDGHPFGPARENGLRAPTLVFLNKPTPRSAPIAAPGIERAAMWEDMAKVQGRCAIFATISEISHLSFADFYKVVPESLTANLGELDADQFYSLVNGALFSFLADVLDLPSNNSGAIEESDVMKVSRFGACDD